MSAADRREELEAALRQAIAKNRKCTAAGKCTGCESNIADVLAAADKYATALAVEELDRFEGRQRLEAASAEYHGSQTWSSSPSS